MMQSYDIIQGNCLDTLKTLPDEFVDLTVTSPPYDNLRVYDGYSFDFENIAKELYRITKQGGVVVWVVGDATVKGSESGTSFKQALFFKDCCGFNLHDTMIFQKHGMPTDPRLRYFQRFEYMFVFSKGKPKSYNPIADVKSSGRKNANGTDRRGDTLVVTDKRYDYPEYSVRGNIWNYDVRNMGGLHPAMFPEELAKDHILSWSNEGDLVLDPFSGSGTTAKMALLNNRRFLGCEVSPKYVQISKERIESALKNKT